ncbi:MAG: hypothetical protein EB075_04665 [Bacteroidetes bacterium]|nr:hypothetical protein [Bacteroidota bacterium]
MWFYGIDETITDGKIPWTPRPNIYLTSQGYGATVFREKRRLQGLQTGRAQTGIAFKNRGDYRLNQLLN